MSALGWGIGLGSLVTAVTFPPRAFRDPTGPAWLIAIGGLITAYVVGSLLAPDGFAFIAFCAGVAASTAPFWLLGKSAINERDRERPLAKQARHDLKAAEEARRARIEQQKRGWLASQSGWKPQTNGTILNYPNRPKCVVALGGDGKLFRVVEYVSDEVFEVIADYTFSLRQIISLNVARPEVRKTVYETQSVPIVTSEASKRSSIGRALVGGALLGPVGAVVGAVSGVGGEKVSTAIEERSVAKTVMALGHPQLIIGTSDPDRPVLKIQFDPPSEADEWMYRIQGAQARGS